jgi:hypothetical protein
MERGAADEIAGARGMRTRRGRRPLLSRSLAFVASVSLVGACSGSGPHASPSTSRASSSVTASSPTPAPPGGFASCTAGEVRALVDQFLRAFNAGDQAALQRLWARAGHGFAWYSTDAPGRRISRAAEDRSTLGAYFAERHTHQEALRLTSFQFNGNTAGYGNFQYDLIRQANDLAATAYVGKGAAVCDSSARALGVWSMARDPRTSVLPCANYIDTQPPPESFRVVLGVVALPTSPNYPALQTSRTADGDHPRRLFAKTGLIIKAKTSFELIVPPQIAAPAARLGIGWGGTPSTPSQRIVVSNCPRAGKSEWLAYPGGYWVDHPACAPLIVKTDGKEQQVHVGLGTPCPGQQPPQGPSEQ